MGSLDELLATFVAERAHDASFQASATAAVPPRELTRATPGLRRRYESPGARTMSFGWVSSVIQTEPSMAETVLPAPSTTLRVWLGPSLTAPFLSSSVMVLLLSLHA